MSVASYIPSPSHGVWDIGPIPLRAYAFGIIIGAIVAIMIGERRFQARGGRQGLIGDVAIWAIPFGIVGARIYHVATDPELYFSDGKAKVEIALAKGKREHDKRQTMRERQDQREADRAISAHRRTQS